MVRYLGSKISFFAAVITPLFVCCPLIFGVASFCTSANEMTALLLAGGFLCALIWGLYIRNVSNQLYSWGLFQNEGVRVMIGLSKSSVIIYEKCKACGIGSYIHGILNSKVGTKIYYIYLSYDAFDETFRTHINLWKPSKTQIKLEFSKKVYEHLIDVLPNKQKQMLRQDFEKMSKARGWSSDPSKNQPHD